MFRIVTKMALLEFCQDTADRVTPFIEGVLSDSEYSRDEVIKGAVLSTLLQISLIGAEYGKDVAGLVGFPVAGMSEELLGKMNT